MTPAGGDRFLGMGELAVLAGAHEEADTSSRLGNDYTEDLCWFPSDGGNVKDLNLEEAINASFHAVNTAHKLPEHRNLKLPTRESLFISVACLYIGLETSKKY